MEFGKDVVNQCLKFVLELVYAGRVTVRTRSGCSFVLELVYAARVTGRTRSGCNSSRRQKGPVIYSMKAHAGNPVTVYLIPSIMGSQ